MHVSQEKKDLSYSAGELLGLYINKKTHIRPVAQKNVKNQLSSHFYPFSLKMALTYLERVLFQATKVCRQNWQKSALDGPAQNQRNM